MKKIELSPLAHTWILDLDGTILKHNGYLTDGRDSFLQGAKEFLSKIPEDDYILFITSRKEQYASDTISFLRENGIRYNKIIFDMPYGERVLINDKKPSGLEMSRAINFDRDCFDLDEIYINENL